jgi:hypothetical protein
MSSDPGRVHAGACLGTGSKTCLCCCAALRGRGDAYPRLADGSSVATAGDVVAPSQMEQSFDIGSALLQLVRSDGLRLARIVQDALGRPPSLAGGDASTPAAVDHGNPRA